MKRFWELASRDDYNEIRKQLARYVHETIPCPSQAGGILWSLTALPSTSKRKGIRRLLTLNVGSVEVLYVSEFDLLEGGSEIEWCMNLWPDELEEKLQALTGSWVHDAGYRTNDSYKSAGPLISVDCPGTDVFASALNQQSILNAAYRLNVLMMRRSTSMYAKFHNQSFAADVLREAYLLI